MHARAVAAMTTAFLGVALLTPLSHARAVQSGDDDGPAVIAHRGASGYAPENTLAAVDKAAELGIRWVENDVQRTRDGELVVLHDDNLRRTTDVEEVFPDRSPWKVKDFTAAEIASWTRELVRPAVRGRARADAGAVPGARGAQPPEAAAGAEEPPAVPGHRAADPQGARQRGLARPVARADRLVVQSFSADSVRTVHELKPAVRTGVLGTPPVSDLPEYAEFADQINPSHGSLSMSYVSSVHAFTGPHGRPMEVFAWTVDDADTARRVAGYDVDGVISNRPDVVREAMDEDTDDAGGADGSRGGFTVGR